MTNGIKIMGIIGLLLLTAIAVILGIMASADGVSPPIVNVDIPESPLTVENEFSPDITLDPMIDVEVTSKIGAEGPRYDKETVEAIMRNRDYPWFPKSFKVEHHDGRVWHVLVRFQSHSRLYIFDEPL